MATSTPGDPDEPGVLARLWSSGFVGYLVGFEVFLAVVAALALTFMGETAMQGVIVGMAISLIVLSLGAVVIGLVYAAIRDALAGS